MFAIYSDCLISSGVRVFCPRLVGAVGGIMNKRVKLRGIGRAKVDRDLFRHERFGAVILPGKNNLIHRGAFGIWFGTELRERLVVLGNRLQRGNVLRETDAGEERQRDCCQRGTR